MDEIQENLLYFPMLLCSILFIIITITSFKQVKSSSRVTELAPPGPWKLPMIGSIHHLVGNLPVHKRFRELSEIHGPLMHLQVGQIPIVVVSSAKVAQEIYKTKDLIFANRPRTLASDTIFYGPSDIIMSPFGDQWKLLRKISSQQLLNVTRVRSLQAVLWEKEVRNLMKSIAIEAEARSCINLTHKVFVTICCIAAKSAFGRKHKGHLEAILSVSDMLTMALSFQVKVSSMFPSWKWLHVICGVTRKVEEKHRKVDLVLENIIAGEEGDDHDDDNDEDEGKCLLSVLLKMKDHGDLTINNVKALMVDIIMGGSDAPPVIIEWAMVEMLKNPRVMQRAQEEVREVVFKRNKGYMIVEAVIEKLEYLKAKIKETMRLHTPSPLLAPRESRERCEINGYTIPSGTQVLVNAWAIARVDPNFWGTSSEEFLPERFLNNPIDYKGFNFEFIPFGGGRRVCPGIVYGVTIVEMILANLLCYIDWELPCGTNPETLDMTEVMRSTMRRKSNIILVPVPYNPSC